MEKITTFAELMKLDKIDENTFRSTTNAYQPGGDVAKKSGIRPLSYGGHVYAQSVLAAAQTIPSNLICHSVTGHFLQGANSELSFVFSVRTIRNGRNFCLRSVDVTQSDKEGLCFTCICSFKKSEDHKLEFQPQIDKEFASLLHGIRPEDHPEAISADTPWFHKAKGSYNGPPFPGLLSRMVDMTDFNRERLPINHRQLHLYSLIGNLPSLQEAPNLHAAAHLYACDRNSLYIVSRLLDVQKYYGITASLSYTVIFHSTTEALSMTESNGSPRWFTQEIWTDRLADSRGLHHSRIWDSNNSLIATTIQDGLMRLNFKSDEEYWNLRNRLSRGGRL